MKRFKKKVTRITGILILSLGLFISPLFASAPKAASSTTVTSYGQYYYESGYENANFMYQLTESWLFKNISACSYITFAYDFKDTYDGYVNLTVTAAQSFAWQNIHFYCEGAVFTQQPNMTNSSATKSFQVQFQSSKGFKVVLFDTSASIFNSSSKITVGSSNFNLQPNVADELDALHTSWDYYVPGMSTSLSNIANNSSTIASDVAILKSYVDQLEGYVDNLEPLLNTLLEYSRLRDSVDIPVYSRFAYINLLRYGVLSDQYNYPYSTAQYGFFPTILTSNYSTPTYNSDFDVYIPAGKTLHFIYTISYWANIFDFIDSNSNSINPSVVMIEGNNYYRSYDVSYTNTGSSNIFVNVAMNRNANRPVIPLYLGCYVPAEVAQLFDMDFSNTYTRLLTSIDSGIQAIASNPTVINNTETIINNYETAYNEVNNIENNVLIDFSSDLNDVNVNITNSGILGDLSTSMTGAVNWFDYSFGLVQGIDLFKYPVYTILVLFVLGCLLG